MPSDRNILQYSAASGSWSPTTPVNTFDLIKAFGTFYSSGSLNTTNGQANFLPFSGYNFISASYQGAQYQITGSGGMATS